MTPRIRFRYAVGAVFLLLGLAVAAEDPEYISTVESWQAEHEANLKKDFTGLKWFPADAGSRVTARFSLHAAPKNVEMLNILGDIESFENPGPVDFELNGASIRTEPLSSREGTLWCVFRDGTSGTESYPAARFVRTEAPAHDEVAINFNRSVNPPCAHNPHTTCPMPTKQNRLKVRIEAGEKVYKKHY